MGLPQNNILDQIYQLNEDTVLKFCTKTNIRDRQTFILAPVPHSYKTFKICIFDGLNDTYSIYENCNIVFTDNQEFRDKIKKTYGKPLNFDCYFAKVVESGGTNYSSAIVETKMPIDIASIKLLDGQEFSKSVESEVETRKKQKLENQEKSAAIRKYAEIEQSIRSLITCDVTIDSKRVNYRDPALGSKASYESYYSYDSETTTEEYGLGELIKIFNFCIVHYGFIESDDTIKISMSYQETLSKMLRDKKTPDINEAISCNKKLAAALRDRYISFLKYLLSNNINPLEESFHYTRTWEKNGFGDDKKYTLVVSEPIMEVGDGLLNYITKAISQEEGINFDSEVENLLENLDNHKITKK